MHEFKEGSLKSGSGKKVTSRKQAIAVALSEARQAVDRDRVDELIARKATRYVAVAEMGGLGSVSEPRLNLNVTHGTVDRVSSKLPALQAYQLSIGAPTPPAGSFDAAAAARGKVVFEGNGQCASCHSGALFTDANDTLHPPADSMAEPETPSYASRSATKQYRTTPLRGIWQHAPYFHDGSAATLSDVVAIYNTRKSLGLTTQQSADLVEYLKSL